VQGSGASSRSLYFLRDRITRRVKLLQNIQAISTGRKIFCPVPIEHTSLIERDLDYLTVDRVVGREYRIEVKLGASVTIPVEKLTHSKEEKEVVIATEKRKIGRAIAQHVYGEVREKLFELAIELRKREHYSVLEKDPALDMTEY
jgi:hypothetical protein